MKVEKNHTNALGFTHGGAIFSLADYAFAQACNFGDNVAVAVQVSINFVKPSVEGDTLTAEAVRVSDGKSMGLYNVTVRNQDKHVAFFLGVSLQKINADNTPLYRHIEKSMQPTIFLCQSTLEHYAGVAERFRR